MNWLDLFRKKWDPIVILRELVEEKGVPYLVAKKRTTVNALLKAEFDNRLTKREQEIAKRAQELFLESLI